MSLLVIGGRVLDMSRAPFPGLASLNRLTRNVSYPAQWWTNEAVLYLFNILPAIGIGVRGALVG